MLQAEAAPATRPAVTIPERTPRFLRLDSSRIFVHSEYEEAGQGAMVATSANIEVFLVGGQFRIRSAPSFLILIRKT